MPLLPREIFDLILLSFATYTCPPTSRFPVLTPASKQGILNARLAWPTLRLKHPFKALFLSVMAETLFIIPTGYSNPPFPEALEAFSESPYAKHVTKLSFQPPLSPAWRHSNVPRANPLIRILQRFCQLREVRYYTQPRVYLDCPWVPAKRGDLVLRPDVALPFTMTGLRSWAFLETHHQINERLGNYLNELAGCLASAHTHGATTRNTRTEELTDQGISPIETFRMPLYGNMASFTATIGDDLFRTQPLFTTHLRRIEVNLLLKEPSVFDLSPPAIGPWIYACDALEYLDIAVTRAGIRDPRASVYLAQRPRVRPQRMLALEDRPLGAELPKRLMELRIMAKPDILFDDESVLDFITGLTPSLKKIGLAHFVIGGIGMGFWGACGLCR